MDAQAKVDTFMAEQAPQPDAQPDAQAMVDKFMAEQALPPPPPEPSLGGFLSGLGSMVTSSFGSDPKFDILNRALGGSIQTSTDATRRAADSLTSDQRASLEEYAAPAMITAASMLVPGGMAAQAATNIGANALVHGEEAYRKGESVLSAMNPLNHPGETAIAAFAPPVVTGAAGLLRGLRSTGASAGDALQRAWMESSGMVDSARRLVLGGPPEGPARLGLEEALRLDAPLRPLPSYPKAAPVAMPPRRAPLLPTTLSSPIRRGMTCLAATSWPRSPRRRRARGRGGETAWPRRARLCRARRATCLGSKERRASRRGSGLRI